MRFLPLALVFAMAPVCAAPRPTSTPAPSFEQKFPKSLAQMDQIQNPDVRALLKAAIKRYGFIRNVTLSPDGKKVLFLAFGPEEKHSYDNGRTYSFEPPFAAALQIVQGVPELLVLPREIVDIDIFKPHYVAAFSWDGGLLALAQTDDGKVNAPWRSVAVFDTRTWKVVRVLPPQSNSISSLAFSRDGTRLLVGDVAGGVASYQVANGQKLLQWRYYNTFKTMMVGWMQIQGQERAVTVAASRNYPTSDDSPSVSQSKKEAAQLWDVEHDEQLASFSELADVRIATIGWSGSRIALGDRGVIFSNGLSTSSQVAVASWPDGLPLISYQALRVDHVDEGYSSFAWTPDDQNLIAFTVGPTKDDTIRVLTPKSQTPSP